jgi:predicted nuclease of predicted toxin-antitoxin system
MSEPVRLYFDNDVNLTVVAALRSDGYDILTSPEAGNATKSDEEQLEYATHEKRVILTFNGRHFKRLHSEWQTAGKMHTGILTSGHVNRVELLRRLRNFLQTRTAQEMVNGLERLHDYR